MEVEVLGENACNRAAPSMSAGPSAPMPAVKTTRAMRMLGTVVHSMNQMCVKRSVPATVGARLVVSESRESLSPK